MAGTLPKEGGDLVRLAGTVLCALFGALVTPWRPSSSPEGLHLHMTLPKGWKVGWSGKYFDSYERQKRAMGDASIFAAGPNGEYFYVFLKNQGQGGFYAEQLDTYRAMSPKLVVYRQRFKSALGEGEAFFFKSRMTIPGVVGFAAQGKRTLEFTCNFTDPKKATIGLVKEIILMFGSVEIRAR